MPRDPSVHRHLRLIAQEHHHIYLNFRKELDELADRQGYLGVIYADGNRMGDRLLQLHYPKELKDFSHTVDGGTRTAITEVLLARYATRETRGNFPVLVPLCGGDDLVVIAPGQDALRIAIDYLKGFQDYAQQHLPAAVAQRIGSKDLSACAGVVIAKDHTPLAALVDLAHALCQSAKARSYVFARPAPGTPSKEVPCLDFQVITTPSWKDLREIRATEYRLDERTRLTARPYTVDGAERLLKAVQILKRVKFPPGKLQELYRALRSGRMSATFHYLTLSMRARSGTGEDSQQKALREVAEHLGVDLNTSLSDVAPPWQVWSELGRDNSWRQTPYGDLMEIYAFVPA
jgi:hypothetical protein